MTWNQLRPTADLVGSVGSTNGCVDSKSVSREPSPKKRIPSGNSQPKSKDSESENYPATYVKADGRIIASRALAGRMT